ncbi:MAG: protein-L-isoaspartate(D-aspartate) O-methyltransferase [Bacteroidetes bacterium]|nr:protein-L-isoaspartate(D-aspartate) O-methyltransferase [Bacteroidota bacterium]
MKNRFILLLIPVLFLTGYILIKTGSGTRKDILQPADSTIGWQKDAKRMVETQLSTRDIKDTNVLRVMALTPRHLFVPPGYRNSAYSDSPLPIGYGQTISQPYIVALMTELLQLTGREKILEIGTGSGYQAAILSQLCEKVYSIEIICPLADSAALTLKRLNFNNVKIKCDDGYKGWPEFAPYDGIIVTAAPEEIPDELAKQLKNGGRMVVPVGKYGQELILITKTPDGIKQESITGVRFVPMVHPDR